MSEITKIGSEEGVAYQNGAIIIYDMRGAYSPRTLLVLDDEAMQNLITWYTDGLCPVCFDQIPEGDILCASCAHRV